MRFFRCSQPVIIKLTIFKMSKYRKLSNGSDLSSSNHQHASLFDKFFSLNCKIAVITLFTVNRIQCYKASKQTYSVKTGVKRDRKGSNHYVSPQLVIYSILHLFLYWIETVWLRWKNMTRKRKKNNVQLMQLRCLFCDACSNVCVI